MISNPQKSPKESMDCNKYSTQPSVMLYKSQDSLMVVVKPIVYENCMPI